MTNSARENRPSINVSLVGDKGDKDAAKMYRGLIRHIERQSKADIAYDTAFFNSVAMGWGYWRILTEWEDEESFDQTIVIKRIRNPFTVYLDPDRLEPDGSDARYGFVTEIIPEDEFKREYPDAQMAPFEQGGQGEKYKSWKTSEGIRVAEYYEVVKEPATRLKFTNGYEQWEEDLTDEEIGQIEGGKLEVEDEREAFKRRVDYFKVNGVQILERTDWLGKWIPIIPVLGDEIDIEGKVRYSGVVRNAKDPQRMYNYWVTSEAELVALAPKAPYIMEEGQVEGHERQWKSANRKPMPGAALQGHQRQRPSGPAAAARQPAGVQVPRGRRQCGQAGRCARPS